MSPALQVGSLPLVPPGKPSVVHSRILTEYLYVSDSADAGRHNRNTEQVKTPALTEFLFQCILIHVLI